MFADTYQFGSDKLRGWLQGDFSIPLASEHSSTDMSKSSNSSNGVKVSIPLTPRRISRRPRIMVNKISILKHSIPLRKVFELIR